MISFIYLLLFVTTVFSASNAQVLFQCDFDTGIDASRCFKSQGLFQILVAEKLGSLSVVPPTVPYSDVTSSLKPTTNSESCNLPYFVGNYTWDMYFCNDGFCPTTSNPSTPCRRGRFAYHTIFAPKSDNFLLFNGDNGFNGTNEQCLVYYYYLPRIANVQLKIEVTKEEADGSRTTIDTVTQSPYNGWVKRPVNYMVGNRGYKIYFRLEKAAGSGSSASVFGLDEITVTQGICPGESTTSTTEETSTTSATTKTTTSTSTTSSSSTTSSTTSASTTKMATTVTTSTTTSTSTTVTSRLTTTTTSTAVSTTRTSDTTTTTTATISTTVSITPALSSATDRTTTGSPEPASSSAILPSDPTVETTRTTVSTTSEGFSTTTPNRLSAMTTITTIASEPSNSGKPNYMIIVGVVIPIVLIGIIGGVIWKTKCFPKRRKQESDGIQIDPIGSSSDT